MAKLKCTGLNCPVQYTYADPKTCAEPEKCPYATFPRTNADRIREMTDEELAEKASRMSFCSGCPVKDCCGYEPDECAKAWLRAPVESEGEA